MFGRSTAYAWRTRRWRVGGRPNCVQRAIPSAAWRQRQASVARQRLHSTMRQLRRRLGTNPSLLAQRRGHSSKIARSLCLGAPQLSQTFCRLQQTAHSSCQPQEAAKMSAMLKKRYGPGGPGPHVHRSCEGAHARAGHSPGRHGRVGVPRLAGVYRRPSNCSPSNYLVVTLVCSNRKASRCASSSRPSSTPCHTP